MADNNIPAPPKPGTAAYRNLPQDSMANGYIDTIAWNPEEKRWVKTSLLAAGNGNYVTETTWYTGQEKDLARQNAPKGESKVADVKVGIDAYEINPNIDATQAANYLNDPKLKKDAQKILSLQAQGLMDAEGKGQVNPYAGYVPTVSSPRDMSGLAAGQKAAVETKATAAATAKKKDLDSKIEANRKAVRSGKAKPFADVPDTATPTSSTPVVSTPPGGGVPVPARVSTIRGYNLSPAEAAVAPVAKAGASGTGTTTPTPSATGGGTGASGGGVSAVAAKEQAKRVAESKVWASYLRTVFNTIPDEKQKKEVLDLIAKSVKSGINEKAFLDQLKVTVWGQTTALPLQAFIVEQNDPRKKADFLAHIKNTELSIKTNLEALGVNINQVDPVTNKVMTVNDFNDKVKSISIEMLRNGWDIESAQYKTYLSNNVNLIFSGGGTLGTSFNAIQARAWQYGQDISKEKNFINSSLLDVTDGRDANWWLEEMKRRAMDDSALKPYAEGFGLGRTLDNQTTNVRKIIGTLLEVDPTNVSWDTIKKYAIKYDDKGNALARNDSEVTKEIKKTPEWGLTKNGKETYVNMAESIKQMFGMVG